MAESHDEIREALRTARETLGLSQSELGHRTGMLQSQVSRIESGAVDPRMSTVLEVARALDLDLMLVPRRLVPLIHRLIEDARRGDDLSTTQRPLYVPSSEGAD